MKVDVEQLKKHYFWILLGASVPLILIALLVDGLAVPATIAQEKDKADKEIDKLTKTTEVKNEDWVQLAKDDADRYEKLKTKVWEQAWKAQEPVFNWPATFEANYQFRDGLFARSITVAKKEDVPASEPPKTTGKEKVIVVVPAEEKVVDDFQGIITKADPDSIWVKGAKEEQFRKRDSENPQFDALKENEVIQVINRTSSRTDEFVGTVTKHDADLITVKWVTEEQFRNTGTTTVTREGTNNPSFESLKENDPVKVNYQRGKYFGDVLSENEISFYLNNYKQQLFPLLKIPEPFRPEDGLGVVQFRNWAYKADELPPPNNSFFNYIALKPDQWIRSRNGTEKEKRKVISDEIWTAQENLWIQEEIYRLIRQANEQVAAFQCLGAEGEDPITFLRPGAWRLDLKVAKGRLLARVINLGAKRKLGELEFQVRWSPDDPSRMSTFQFRDDAELESGGQYPPDGSFRDVAGADAQGVFGVQQVLVARALDYKGPDNTGQNAPSPATFTRDDVWQLDLKVANGRLLARVTNLGNEKRRLGNLQFQVRWNPDDASKTSKFQLKDDVVVPSKKQYPPDGSFRDVAAAGAQGVVSVQQVVTRAVDYECPGSASHNGPGPITFAREGAWQVDLMQVGRNLQARVTNIGAKRKMGELQFQVRWGLDNKAKTTRFKLKYDREVDKGGRYPRDGSFQNVGVIPDEAQGIFGVQAVSTGGPLLSYEFSNDPFRNTYYWVNPSWRLKLRLERDQQNPEKTKLAVSVKNLTRFPQGLNAEFKFKVNDQTNVKPDKQFVQIRVQSDFLKPYAPEAKAVNSPLELEEQVKITGIYGVSQILSWDTAAVKRLDELSFGAAAADAGGAAPPGGGPVPPAGGGGGSGKEGISHSNRTFPIGLQALFEGEKGDTSTTSTGGNQPPGPIPPGGAPTPPGGGAIPPGGAMPPGAPGGKQPGGTGSTVASPNKLNFKRYSELTPQARRVPVVVVLIVDQDQVGPVLASFSNSKMRFLVTQVLVNRYPKSIRPVETIDTKKLTSGGTPTTPPPTTPPGTPPGEEGASGAAGGPMSPGGGVPSYPGGGMPPLGGFVPPGFSGGQSQTRLSGGDDRQTNVELVIYGIASIYQRYPAAPAESGSTPPATKQ